jgi:orotate phosphoribosyltransferase
MSNMSQLVAQQLLKINAVKLSPDAPFTWASGIKSPIYCDNRIVLSHPQARNVIKQAFVEKANSFGEFDVVAGVATAGIPHGALLADALGKPFIYVRDKAKGHGRQNQIEGEVAPYQKVLVIEDLISTGGSSMKAIEALREANVNIAGLLAIFTYGFPVAKALFDNAAISFDTLTNYAILLQEAVEMNYIESSHLDTLKVWSKNPSDWGI